MQNKLSQNVDYIHCKFSKFKSHSFVAFSTESHRNDDIPTILANIRILLCKIHPIMNFKKQTRRVTIYTYTNTLRRDGFGE